MTEPFLTDEWDPFAPIRAERAKQTEVEPDAGPEPVHSWGNGAHGRPSEAFVDPGEQMTRLLSDQWRWMKHGIPPRPHIPEGMGIVPFVD